MQNFVRFHAIESKIELSQEFWGKKRSSSDPFRDMCTRAVSLLFLMIHVLYINFCAISSTKLRSGYFKILEKMKLQRYLLRNFHQKMIDINLCFDNTKDKISLNSVG